MYLYSTLLVVGAFPIPRENVITTENSKTLSMIADGCYDTFHNALDLNWPEVICLS